MLMFYQERQLFQVIAGEMMVLHAHASLQGWALLTKNHVADPQIPSDILLKQ